MSTQIKCADIPVIAGLTDAPDYCTERSANPGVANSGVIKANFPVVSANTYNDDPVPNHNRMMDPYRIFTLEWREGRRDRSVRRDRAAAGGCLQHRPALHPGRR